MGGAGPVLTDACVIESYQEPASVKQMAPPTARVRTWPVEGALTPWSHRWAKRAVRGSVRRSLTGARSVTFVLQLFRRNHFFTVASLFIAWALVACGGNDDQSANELYPDADTTKLIKTLCPSALPSIDAADQKEAVEYGSGYLNSRQAAEAFYQCGASATKPVRRDLDTLFYGIQLVYSGGPTLDDKAKAYAHALDVLDALIASTTFPEVKTAASNEEADIRGKIDDLDRQGTGSGDADQNANHNAPAAPSGTSPPALRLPSLRLPSLGVPTLKPLALPTL